MIPAIDIDVFIAVFLKALDQVVCQYRALISCVLLEVAVPMVRYRTATLGLSGGTWKCAAELAWKPTFKGSVCPYRFFVLRAPHTMSG